VDQLRLRPRPPFPPLPIRSPALASLARHLSTHPRCHPSHSAHNRCRRSSPLPSQPSRRFVSLGTNRRRRRRFCRFRHRRSHFWRVVNLASTCSQTRLTNIFLLAGLWEGDWRFRTPPFLSGKNAFLDTFDLWAGAITAITYGAFAPTHPSYSSLLALPEKPFMTPLAARAVAIIVLASLYEARAVVVHWWPTLAQPTPTPTSQPVTVNGRKKKQ
jgi:hypothetical protein